MKRSPRTPLPRVLLPGLLPVLLLTACATAPVRLATPPVEWAAPVAYPAIPAGEAVCEGAPCLSDRESAGVMAGLADALDEANGRLLKLRDWIVAARK